MKGPWKLEQPGRYDKRATLTGPGDFRAYVDIDDCDRGRVLRTTRRAVAVLNQRVRTDR